MKKSKEQLFGGHMQKVHMYNRALVEDEVKLFLQTPNIMNKIIGKLGLILIGIALGYAWAWMALH